MIIYKGDYYCVDDKFDYNQSRFASNIAFEFRFFLEDLSVNQDDYTRLFLDRDSAMNYVPDYGNIAVRIMKFELNETDLANVLINEKIKFEPKP